MNVQAPYAIAAMVFAAALIATSGTAMATKNSSEPQTVELLVIPNITFEQADTNKDGMLSREEYHAAVTRPMQKLAAKYGGWNQEFDTPTKAH